MKTNFSDKDIEILLDQYKSVRNLDSRLYNEPNRKQIRKRNEYQRDYARILYSPSFRRLQGKMQLMGIHSSKFFRNRLTHSLEVSQISMGIAEYLRDNVDKTFYDNHDVHVVQAASLAHDLGNPPFGHKAEKILNELSSDFGGFEGNAQTLRILHRIERKIPNYEGLNLTKRTLLSVVKYFFKRKNNKNKFLYDEDYKDILKIVKKNNIKLLTIDAQIMDIADEIAYAAHDLEDSLSLRLFNIDDILNEFYLEKNDPFYLKEFNKSDIENAYNVFKQIIEQSRKIAMQCSQMHSSEEFDKIFRKELTSNIVNKLINDIGLIKVKTDSKFHINHKLGFKNHNALSNGLKKLTFNCIGRSFLVKDYERKGNMIIEKLFNLYTDKKFNPKNLYLPIEYQIKKDSQGKRTEIHDSSTIRKIIDYIAGMMDNYAIEQYQKFYGKNSLEILYDEKFYNEKK